LRRPVDLHKKGGGSVSGSANRNLHAQQRKGGMMAKAMKKRFSFHGEEDLKRGSKAAEVEALQSMLAAFGHLRGTYAPGHLCACTERAVRRYQRFYGLRSDGIVGPVTKKHMVQPRCGTPDYPTSPGGVSAGAPFVLRGCKYDRNDLTYGFINGTSDLPASREREITAQAFAVWSAVTNLTFTEVDPGNNPDFRIAWRTHDHGDGSSFDGPGNTLAHAFYPAPCGGSNSGDLHFDESELWSQDPADNGILLLNVAIHEIGHLLGLSHSQDEAAIMFAFYSPERFNLAQDDIDGIQELYSPPSASEQIILQSEKSGTLARTADSALFEVEVPTTLAVSIDGPSDADFDLYVRKGAPPTVDEWDFRAYTVSADETIVFPADPGETYHVMVRSYEGGGDFTLHVKPNAS